MREALRFTGKIMSATISRMADKWFASITVENRDDSHLPKAQNQGAVGVDLGVSALATLSTGETITGAKPHKALLSRLQRLSRGLSRKVKGSENRKKAKAKLARLHARIANIRKEALHQLTTKLTRQFHTIGIEDLNVKGMAKNRHLSRAISDMGFLSLGGNLNTKPRCGADKSWRRIGGMPAVKPAHIVVKSRSHCRYPCAIGRARTAKRTTTAM